MKKPPKIKIIEKGNEFYPLILDGNGYNDISGSYKTESAALWATAYCLYDEKMHLERKYQKLINHLTKFSSRILDIL